VLREATEDIMDAITEVLEGLRGEQAPAERFDLRRAAREKNRQRGAAAAGAEDGDNSEEAGR
jgi:hypothetical protein